MIFILVYKITITIVIWNVNGIRAALKKSFITSIEKINPDIICLQETKAQEEVIMVALSTFNRYNIFNNSVEKKGYAGTAILTKLKPNGVINDMGIDQHDNEGRVQCAKFLNFYLVNVYVPNSGQKLERLNYRKKWDEEFLSYLKHLEKYKPVIVCRDFNVVHQPIDLKNDIVNYNKIAGYTQIEIDGMNNLLKSGFVDSLDAYIQIKLLIPFGAIVTKQESEILVGV